MIDVEARARRALDMARAAHDPSPADGARVRAALGARLRAEPLLLDTPAPPTGALRPILDKLLIALGAGGVAGFAAGFFVAGLVAPAPGAAPHPLAPGPTAQAVSPARDNARVVVTPDRPDAAADGAARLQAADLRSEPLAASPTAPRTATPPRPRSAPAPVEVSPLKAELDGLRRAQELLHQGQPAWAITRLDELDHAKVSSVLLEERAATRAIAECHLDRGSAASRRERVEVFARQHPGSAHLGQVRAICTGTPQDEASDRNVDATQTENRAF